MGTNSHALLSASASKRWMSCPPSARLTEEIEDATSDFALEGTDAHTLCEHKLNVVLNGSTEPTPELEYYSEEMEDCAEGYKAFVLEAYEGMKKVCSESIVLIEQRLDFSNYVPDGFGTGDCVIVGVGVLHIIDYKHGMGVLVSSENNPQMMLYALGALNIFDDLYDIEKVKMTIYQPRLSNVSTFEMSKEQLLQWAKDELVPKANLAYRGEGEFSCGEWCRWCKIKNICRERANHNMALAAFDFKQPPFLNDDEIVEILSKVDGLVNWANEIKDYCLQEALKGKKWNGWKLVEGRSNRKYVDEDAVANALTTAGIDPYEQKLLSITELTKRIGKTKFAELVEKYVVKPQGKPCLTTIDDKRAEMIINSAQEDFKNNDNMEEN